MKNSRRSRRNAPLIWLLLLVVLIGFASCKRTADGGNSNAANGNSSTSTDGTSSTPPFPTKEPDRYQATWVTTGNGGTKTSGNPGLSVLTNREMPVARDGDKRRMETELLPGVKVVYLQLAKSRYLLYPAKKLYAEIKFDGENSTDATMGTPSDFAPDKLIGSAPAGAKYEKLGTEVVNGRTTTKYRVTKSGENGAEASDAIIWADESLGMPIKMEMKSKDGAAFTMELRNIKLEVDPAIFVLPKDYKKVEHSDLLTSALPSVDDILGIVNEKKTTKKP